MSAFGAALDCKSALAKIPDPDPSSMRPPPEISACLETDAAFLPQAQIPPVACILLPLETFLPESLSSFSEEILASIFINIIRFAVL